MKSDGASKESGAGQATEYQHFTEGLRKILSVRKSDLDLHKPIRPRTNAKPKKAKS